VTISFQMFTAFWHISLGV